jgi:signal transduction histidine kinase
VTALKGYQELVDQSLEESSPIKPLVGRIGKAAGAIERLLLFTRDYQSLGAEDPGWHDVHYSILMTKAQLGKDELLISDSVGNLQVYADPLIDKVFYNLVENAIRHGQHVRNIRFSYYRKEDGIFIVCEDDGVGIPADDKVKIFREGYGGHSGFGLFFIPDILSITNMTIRENGEYGHGARFEIFVPEGFFRFGGPEGKE